MANRLNYQTKKFLEYINELYVDMSDHPNLVNLRGTQWQMQMIRILHKEWKNQNITNDEFAYLINSTLDERKMG